MGATSTVSGKAQDLIKEEVVANADDLFRHVGVRLGQGQRVSVLKVDADYVFFPVWKHMEASLLRAAIKGHDLEKFRTVQFIKFRLDDVLWTARTLGVAVNLLIADGTERSPKLRVAMEPKEGEIVRSLIAIEKQPNKGRKQSVSNHHVAADLSTARIVGGHDRAAILLQGLEEAGARGTVTLLHESDANFFDYGPNAPDVQLLLTGTRSHNGDYDPLFQLAYCPNGKRFIVILSANPLVGKMRFVEAAVMLSTTVSRFFVESSRGKDTRDYSRPYDDAVDKNMWLTSMLLTSLHGAQDYAAAVEVTLTGKEAKTLWISTLCKALDKWLVRAAKKKSINFSDFIKALPDVAGGMLFEQSKDQSCPQFAIRLCESLTFAGLGTIKLTRQGAKAEKEWRRFLNERTVDIKFGSFEPIELSPRGLPQCVDDFLSKYQPLANAALEKREKERKLAVSTGVLPFSGARDQARPAFFHGKPFVRVVPMENTFAVLSEKPSKGKGKDKKDKKSAAKRKRGEARGGDKGPGAIPAAAARHMEAAYEDEEEGAGDDDDADEDWNPNGSKNSSKKSGGTGLVTVTRASNLGSFAANVGERAETFKTELKRVLSDEPVLASMFLLRLAPLLGADGFPVCSNAFWETLLRDLGAMMARDNRNPRVQWIDGTRGDTGPRLSFREAKLMARQTEVIFPAQSESEARGLLAGAVGAALNLFTAEDQKRLASFFLSCRETFVKRWGGLVARGIRTPMVANLDRLVFGVVRAGVSDCFSSAQGRAAWKDDKIEAFAKLETESSTFEAANGFLFGDTFPGLVAALGKYKCDTASLATLLDQCRNAIDGLVFNLNAPRTVSGKFHARKDPQLSFSSLLAVLDKFEAMWRTWCPEWTRYARYPEVRQRWRCTTSSTELKEDWRFDRVRAAFRLANDQSSMCHGNLEMAMTEVLRNPEAGNSKGWVPANEGELNWTMLLRLAASDSAEWPEYRNGVFSKYEKLKVPHISVVTDGHNLKLVGGVEAEATPWLSKFSSRETRMYAETMILIGEKLGVDLRAELRERAKHKANLPKDAEKDYRVLSAEELWAFIKRTTTVKRDEWMERVYGAENKEFAERARAWENGEMTYPELGKAREQGVDWCRKSAVTGMAPSWILAEIRGAHYDKVPACFNDTGQKNMYAGTWRYIDSATGKVMMQPFRITNGLYHQRVGLNRERERRERQGNVGLSWEQRASDEKARMRRTVEEGKRQFKMEIVGAFRLAADRLGDGRDPAIIVEHDNKGNRGGFGHRKPATGEFVWSLAQFFLVGTAWGHRTSQCCPCCGEQTEFGNKKREIRSKVCLSPDCPGSARMQEAAGPGPPAAKKGKGKGKGKGKKSSKAEAASKAKTVKRPFYTDRDVMAAVNLCLIDEAEARGEERPERFQSEYYKRRKHVSSSN